MKDIKIGNLEIKITLNTEKLFNDIKKIEEKEEIYDIYLDGSEVRLYCEEDFYVIDLMDYIEIE